MMNHTEVWFFFSVLLQGLSVWNDRPGDRTARIANRRAILCLNIIAWGMILLTGIDRILKAKS